MQRENAVPLQCNSCHFYHEVLGCCHALGKEKPPAMNCEYWKSPHALPDVQMSPIIELRKSSLR
jgi:hypothetical protein